MSVGVGGVKTAVETAGGGSSQGEGVGRERGVSEGGVRSCADCRRRRWLPGRTRADGEETLVRPADGISHSGRRAAERPGRCITFHVNLCFPCNVCFFAHLFELSNITQHIHK